MFGIHLFFFQICALFCELRKQLVQHRNHPTRLELIGIGLRCRHCTVVTGFEDVHALGQEKINRLLGRFRNQLESVQLLHLDEGLGLGLLTVVVLLLQHSNGILQSVDRLGVVVVRLVIIALFNLTNLRGCCNVALPDRDVLVKVSNFLGEFISGRLGLGNIGLQDCYLLCGLLDGSSLCSAGVVAPLLVGRELHLLCVLLLLALGQHAIHEINDFLDWSHFCSSISNNSPGAEKSNNDRHCAHHLH
mmetsp:Transcript_112516/g.206491  ORF Transcript_112516/g.206491 Transcript_112516/m.206491 type:complete len:247 (-) Transcript_112516:53-793(-)